ncbi:MAG: hypothetical protein OES41_10710, partial [Rhodospirillales bacterium]|nr:hypothetical protein [Rhodospirillales bacterium]
MKCARRAAVAALCLFSILAITTSGPAPAAALELIPGAQAAGTGCLSCHEGIERFSDGAMQDTIEAIGADYGDPGGCVVC